MEIDDILASIGRGDETSPESIALDHQLLTRFWVAERAVSELLPWPGALMERMLKRIRNQIETIENLASSSSSAALNLRLAILQTDLARTQYLVRSLLRQRLAKLTSHSMHYLQLITGPRSSSTSSSHHQQPEDSVPDPSHVADSAPLSPQEAAFVHAHQLLLAGHYGASFLGSFPAQLKRLDDNAGGTRMVQGPETREVVFVRCLGDAVPVVVPPGEGLEEEIDGELSMRMGDVWVVRWEGVRRAWENGDVELL